MKHKIPLLLLFLIICLSGCEDDAPSGIKPVPGIVQDRYIVERGNSISFTDASLAAASYLWDFGDGNT